MPRKALFAAVTLGLLLLISEGAVRLGNLDGRYFGNPFLGGTWWTAHLMPDPFVQWRGQPGLKVSWANERLNSRGYRGPDFDGPKGAGVRRVALLGDSCTFGLIRIGNNKYTYLRNYGQRLQPLLDVKYGRGRFEVFNYAHVGYTSYHGRRILYREALAADPDFVIIRFGWNDHSSSRLGHGYSDPESPLLEGLKYALFRSRLAGMVLFRGLPQFSARKIWQSSAHPIVWVTPEDYARNLARMIRLARDHGAAPVLLDVPAGPVTPELLRMRGYLKITGYDTFAHFLEAHARYQEVAASVAAREGVPYVRTGLAAPAAAPGTFFNRYDFSHPNRAGQARIARRLFGEISALADREER